jgi:hypothetical protein
MSLMQATGSSETSVSCHTIWRHNPEDHDVYLRRSEHVKCRIDVASL